MKARSPQRVAWLLFALALLVRAAGAWFQTQPGYMDAAYYFDVALSLARGTGLTENFVWNYLSHPAGLPQPGNAYWMPLTSFIVAPFLWLAGDSYRAAQVPMVLLSALLVPLTYVLSMKLFQRKNWALVSSLLMLASSFYAPFGPAVDSFALYALLGTGVLWLSARLPSSDLQAFGESKRESAEGMSPAASSRATAEPMNSPAEGSPASVKCLGHPMQSPPASARSGGQLDPHSIRTALMCGVLAGLAHLTRADGFLLLLAPLAVWRTGLRPWKAIIPLLAGYVAVVLPWFARNVAAFGTPLPGGGTLFMQSYNDLFAYDQALTLDYWLAGGVDHIAAGWLRALVLNAATLAGAVHFVYFPFVCVAAWRLRRLPIVRAGAAALAAIFVLSTFVFSQSGPRGTFLHSLTALLPLMYALAPAGLAGAIGWVSARRTAWHAVEAERVFGPAFVVMAIVLSAFFFASNVFGSRSDLGWNDRYGSYKQVDAFLAREGGTLYGPESPILCINPPAYYYFAHHPAIALPSDDALALIHAAAAFGARMFILEPDHPGYLDTVYDFTVPDQRFQLRATFADATGAQVQLYQIVPLR